MNGKSDALRERVLSRAGSLPGGAHIAVVFGGRSSEREVSLSTGREVAAALSSASDARGPARTSAIEIDAQGRWLLESRELSAGSALALLGPVDVVFLALHGGAGEDGTLQGWLEQAGVRFTGSGVRASALCMDKLAMRGVAAQVGIPVAPAACFSRRTWSGDAQRIERAAELSSTGWVIKPRFGGSSVNTHAVRGRAELARAIESVLDSGDDALVEARIGGTEVSCGVLGNRGEELLALPPVEIQPREGGFFDYQEKYSPQGAREVCPPESLSSAEIERVQEHALAAHAAAGCDGYSRTDFMMPKGGGAPVMLEVNTLPGMTPRSLLPQEAAAIGVDYRSLCLYIAASGCARAESRS